MLSTLYWPLLAATLSQTTRSTRGPSCARSPLCAANRHNLRLFQTGAVLTVSDTRKAATFTQTYRTINESVRNSSHSFM